MLTNLYAMVTQRVGWAELPIGILRLQGADAQKWLHKIVTADVEHLRHGQGVYSALLDAKGHFTAAFVILRDHETFGVFVDLAARETLARAFRRYILREQVTRADVTDSWTRFVLIGDHAAAAVEQLFGARAPENLYDWVWGNQNEIAARIFRSARARVPSYDVMIPNAGADSLRAKLQALPVSSDELLETLRIEAGLPRWGVDFDATTLALEIPDVMRIRVDQGCYVGQEVVARIVHRGHVNRHLRGLRIENDFLPERGEPIQFEGVNVGAITSAAHSPLFGNIALGYTKRAVEIGARVKLNGADARIVELPFPLS